MSRPANDAARPSVPHIRGTLTSTASGAGLIGPWITRRMMSCVSYSMQSRLTPRPSSTTSALTSARHLIVAKSRWWKVPRAGGNAGFTEIYQILLDVRTLCRIINPLAYEWQETGQGMPRDRVRQNGERADLEGVRRWVSSLSIRRRWRQALPWRPPMMILL